MQFKKIAIRKSKDNKITHSLVIDISIKYKNEVIGLCQKCLNSYFHCWISPIINCRITFVTKDVFKF